MSQGFPELNYRRPRLSRRTLLRTGLGSGVTLSAAALLACSSSNNNNATPTRAAATAATTVAGQPTQTASPAAAPAASQPLRTATAAPTGAQPKRGGKIMLSGRGDPPHQDPHLSSALAGTTNSTGIVYSRLLKRTLGDQIDSGQIIPAGDLAASWQQPDDLTYIFKLRPNIRWQNLPPVNGRALTADDVAYSHQRQIALKVTAATLPGVDQITAVDPGTVKLTLKQPNADLLAVLTAAINVVVAREAVELKGDLKNGPVIGTGAWIAKDYTPTVKYTFVRNPDYFLSAPDGKPYPYADELDMVRLDDVSTSLAAFRTKQVHAITPSNVDPRVADVERLKREIPNLTVRYGLENTGAGINLTLRADVPPTNDIRVRQAINKAFSRDDISNTILGSVDAGPLNSAMLSASSLDQLLPESEVRRTLARDMGAAKALAQQAGFTGWKETLWYSTYPPVQPTAELMQAQLKEAGLNTDFTLSVMDTAKTANWYANLDLPLVAGSVAQGLFGTNAYVQGLFSTGGIRNLAHISDPQLDQMITDQAAELKDPKRRAGILQQIQRRNLELAASIPYYLVKTYVVTHPFLHDFFLAYTNEPSVYNAMWLDQ